MNSALYDSFIADYYDESPIVKGRTQDVAFYRDAAREFGDPVLELGCGTGRITMALAEAGKRITGLDLSERMLERAVKSAQRYSWRPASAFTSSRGTWRGSTSAKNSGWSLFPSGHFNTCWRCISR